MKLSFPPRPSPSRRARQPRAKRHPKATGGMSIQCAYLPHAISQANSSNKTAILSTFTNYDGACPRITVTVPPPHTVWTSGRNYASPEAGLASEQTSPRPILESASCPPRIPQKAIPSTVSCMVASPGAGSALASGKLPPHPSMASASIIPMKERPTSPETAELTYYQELFTILTTASTTITGTVSPTHRLGYMTEPQLWPRCPT
jgi:hypothetical protein